jgi:CO/xanthine dehydrogenase Mo-binding subunit
MILPSETPAVHIEFVEAVFDGKQHSAEDNDIKSAPFHTIPAAFLQAVSQAIQHEFVKIPLTPSNIWNFLRKREGSAKL